MNFVHNKRGFTLLELLIVIGIIAVLSMIVMGASSVIAKVSREKRVTMSCTVLETAIQAYHAEYNEWPGGEPAQGKTSTSFFEDNSKVFGPLRVTSSDNSNGIAFLDETAFMTYKNGRVMPLSEAGSGNLPIVFIPKNGRQKNNNGKPFYFKVVIDHSADSVSVTAPSLAAADMDDD